MQDKTIVYVRNRKNTPIGVTCFEKSTATFAGTSIIVMGWSKACKGDTFTKKFGRTVAMKRAEKALKYANTIDDTSTIDYYNGIVEPQGLRESIKEKYGIDQEDKYLDQISSLPFAIKENLSYYIDIAKDSCGIDKDENILVVIPIVEKFVDIVDALKDAITSDSDIVDPTKGKTTTQTRYIALQY